MSIPNLWNLWILPYAAKEWILFCMAKDVIKLRIWRGGAYVGLSRWVLNAICILIRQTHREEEEAVWPKRQRLEWCCHKSRNTQGHQKLKTYGVESPLEPQHGAQPCRHHDFRLLASRTVREKHPIVLRHPIYGDLLQGPRKLKPWLCFTEPLSHTRPVGPALEKLIHDAHPWRALPSLDEVALHHPLPGRWWRLIISHTSFAPVRAYLNAHTL